MTEIRLTPTYRIVSVPAFGCTTYPVAVWYELQGQDPVRGEWHPEFDGPTVAICTRAYDEFIAQGETAPYWGDMSGADIDGEVARLEALPPLFTCPECRQVIDDESAVDVTAPGDDGVSRVCEDCAPKHPYQNGERQTTPADEAAYEWAQAAGRLTADGRPWGY